MKLLCCSTPPESTSLSTKTDQAPASGGAFAPHCHRLQRWLPFATIVCARSEDVGPDDLEPVRMLVYVSATELEVTVEILSGFFAPVASASTDRVRATFVDEGSAPVMVMDVILSGSALDESAQVRNARTNYGGLLGGQEQFATYGINFRRASKDGQQAGKEASLQQAVASV